LSNTKVTDLSPLAGMPLRELFLQGTPVRNLAPLKGLLLTRLEMADSKVEDLTPLQGMPLTVLGLFRTGVKDISAVSGAPLDEIHLTQTRVADLRPLVSTTVRILELRACTEIRDVSPLLDCSNLTHLLLPPGATNLVILRDHPKLWRLAYVRVDAWQNVSLAWEFWADFDKRTKK
jgi:Leucine-rich repeat (LRR) protein